MELVYNMTAPLDMGILMLTLPPMEMHVDYILMFIASAMRDLLSESSSNCLLLKSCRGLPDLFSNKMRQYMCIY